MNAISLALIVALALQASPATPVAGDDLPPFGQPPMAAEVSGPIEQVLLGPISDQPYSCIEHPLGLLPYASDALGSDCTIGGTTSNPTPNKPGVLGRPPAGGMQIRMDDGTMVFLIHATDITLKRGDRVTAGQIIGKVGNNGMSRAPHIHVGAYRPSDNVPLQIRWDLRAMAALYKQD